MKTLILNGLERLTDDSFHALAVCVGASPVLTTLQLAHCRIAKGRVEALVRGYDGMLAFLLAGYGGRRGAASRLAWADGDLAVAHRVMGFLM